MLKLYLLLNFAFWNLSKNIKVYYTKQERRTTYKWIMLLNFTIISIIIPCIIIKLKISIGIKNKIKPVVWNFMKVLFCKSRLFIFLIFIYFSIIKIVKHKNIKIIENKTVISRETPNPKTCSVLPMM